MEIPFRNWIIFNSWPDMSVNRNDSEIKMFTKYFSNVKKREILHFMTNNFDEDEPKSKAVANTHRSKGNSFYKMLQYPLALEMYNKSISRAPRDSTEFALAIGNRSAVLFDMKKYKECLKDVELVLRSEYPKNLFYKVFLRQSKCYFELNLITEAINSLERARESFNKEKKGMGQAQIAVVEDSIQTLSNEIKERKEKPNNSGEINNNEDPSLTLRGGENSKFLNASKAVDLKNNTTLQRYVVATSDIKKGDVLFIEKPYAAAAVHQAETRFTICSFCFQHSLNCIPCSTCTTHFYCSSECQLAAWNLSHKWECFSERRQIISDGRLKIGLSVLFKASQDCFKTEIEDNSVYGNKDNNYAYMNQLLTHKNKAPEFMLKYNIKAAVWMVIYLKHFTDYFDWLYVQKNRPEGSKEDLYNIVGGYIVKFLLQLICNVDLIQEGRIVRDSDDKSLTVHFIGTGLGVYLSTALLNHSCVPNAVQSYHGIVKVVKALKDIKQGTEITVSYLRGNDSQSIAERHSELEKYLFKCTCVACTTPDYEKLLEPYLCPRCCGKAYPIKGTNKFAKCVDCNLSFNKRETHTRNEKKIAELIMIFQLTGHMAHKDTIYTLLKKTYHKDNIIYIVFYNICLKIHEKNGEYKNNIEVIKSLTETTANVFEDTSKQYLITLIECTYNLVEYSNIMKKRKSDLHETFVNEAKEYMKKSVECLHYHMSPKNVNVFVENITEYLNTGKITDDDFEDDDDDCVFERFVALCSVFGLRY